MTNRKPSLRFLLKRSLDTASKLAEKGDTPEGDHEGWIVIGIQVETSIEGVAHYLRSKDVAQARLAFTRLATLLLGAVSQLIPEPAMAVTGFGQLSTEDVKISIGPLSHNIGKELLMALTTERAGLFWTLKLIDD